MARNGILLFIFALLIILTFLPTFSKHQELKEKNEQLQAEIDALKDENTELVRERKLLEEDPVYLENVAREKMGLVRDGEVIYKITPVSRTEE